MARRGENIYHRRDGRWEGRFRPCGSRKYKSVYGKSYREVKEKLQKAKENAMLPAADSMTVEQLITAWLADRQLCVKPSTYAQYRKLTDLYVIPYLGRLQAADLTVQKITDYVQMLSASGSRDAAHGLSASTIRSVVTIIRSVLKQNRLDLSGVAIPAQKAKEAAAFHDSETEKLRRQRGRNLQSWLSSDIEYRHPIGRSLRPALVRH